jgi:uncharacterized protein (DUF2336 family)
VNVADTSDQIAELARARTPAGRAQLLASVIDLCNQADAAGALDHRTTDRLLCSVLLQLTGQVERDIRILLSNRLATAPWAPAALINVLALDDIEIARPVIASSPVLTDADLVQILLKATIEHQIAVASRPALSAEVVHAVLARKEPVVWAALARNETADIDHDGLEQLVEAASEEPPIGEALVHHPRLADDQAARLYLWVGQSLRDALQARFRFDPNALDKELSEAIAGAYASPLGPSPSAWSEPRGPERDEAEERLVDKLHAAGQLRSSYLLRALREGKLGLFEAALAKLGGFTVPQVRRATNASSPVLLALACTAVGLDRSVFPSILCLVRDLNDGAPGGEALAGTRAAEAFSAFPPERAAEAFRRTAI